MWSLHNVRQRPRTVILSNKNELIEALGMMLEKKVIKGFHQAKDPEDNTVRWVIADNDGNTLYFRTNEAQALVKGAMLSMTK